jgi:hypothetical protein
MDYDDCVARARMCANNAHLAESKEAAAQLWRMAREYQEKAAKLDGGKSPDIGKRPAGLAD